MSQKKRNKHYLREKKLIQLRIKDQEIRDAIHNQNLVELEEPIHHGYNAEWVLRDDILRRDDAHVYQEALNACKGKVWSKKPDFKYKNPKTRRWERINPKMFNINKVKYEALSPSAKKFFFETHNSTKYWRIGYNDKEYACTLSYELVVKITKSYITHRREHNEILYQMDAENEKMMYLVAGNGHPWGSNHSSSKWWHRHEDRKDKLQAEREIVDVKKTYKEKDDLLDL